MPNVAPNTTAYFAFIHPTPTRTDDAFTKYVFKNGELFQSSNVRVTNTPNASYCYLVSFDVDDEEGAQYVAVVWDGNEPDVISYAETFTVRSDEVQAELASIRSTLQLILASFDS